MGRKAGGKNKPKSDASNGVGHNSGEDAPLSTGELTDDQKQVIYFGAKRRIVALNEQVATLNLEKRGIFKQLKSELGLLRAEVEYGLTLDDDDAEEKHRRRMMIARWEQHPIGLQADMFGETDRTPAVDRAYADGKRAGLAGDPCNPLHDPSVPQYQRYMEGFHAGQAVLAQGIKPTDDFGQASARLAKEGQKLADEMFGKREEPWPDDAQVGRIGTADATAMPGE